VFFEPGLELATCLTYIFNITIFARNRIDNTRNTVIRNGVLYMGDEGRDASAR
jgi:hypothetical protein